MFGCVFTTENKRIWMNEMQSVLPLATLSTWQLGGELSVVAKDVERVADIGQAKGLTLNISKCRLITESGTVPCHTVIQGGFSVRINSTRCSTDSGSSIGSGLVWAVQWTDQRVGVTEAHCFTGSCPCTLAGFLQCFSCYAVHPRSVMQLLTALISCCA